MREPLAIRMRPTQIDEVVGQTHILNPDSLLYKMIQNDTLSSILLYGPPGTGKTTVIKELIKNKELADFIKEYCYKNNDCQCHSSNHTCRFSGNKCSCCW